MATFRKSGANQDRPVSFGGSLQDQHKFTGVLNVTGASTLFGADDTRLLNLSSESHDNILYASGSGQIGLSTESPRYTLDINGNFGVVKNAYFEAQTFHSGNVEVSGNIHISSETAVPSAPADGKGGLLYAKPDGKIYWKSNEVSEADLTAGVAGSDTQFQFNNGGSLAGAGNLVYNADTGYVGVGVTAGATTHRLTLPNTAGDGGAVKANRFDSYSSKRYKENIETISNPIEAIMNLRGVKFDWIESGQRDVGFIAEEVGSVIPEIVSWESNGVDASSMDYSKITAVLVEAVKQQQKTIQEMQLEIESLNQKIKNKT